MLLRQCLVCNNKNWKVHNTCSKYNSDFMLTLNISAFSLSCQYRRHSVKCALPYEKALKALPDRLSLIVEKRKSSVNLLCAGLDKVSVEEKLQCKRGNLPHIQLQQGRAVQTSHLCDRPDTSQLTHTEPNEDGHAHLQKIQPLVPSQSPGSILSGFDF